MTSSRKKFSSSALLLSFAVIAFLLFVLLVKLNRHQPFQQTASKQPVSEFAKAPRQQAEFDSSLKVAAQQAEYRVNPVPLFTASGQTEEYEAVNRANAFSTQFNKKEIRLHSASGNKQAWQFGLKLKNYGYGTNLLAVTSGEIKATDNRVAIQKSAKGNSASAIEEWYINKPEGIEQGFHISAPPSPKNGNEPLRLTMRWSGNLRAAGDKQSLTFFNARKEEVLRYHQLHAFDATGRELPSHMELRGEQISLLVDDHKATYPLIIDPILSQQSKLTANDGAADDEFGYAVAINGDTAIIGAPFNDGAITNRGAAYIFVKAGAGWVQQAKLVAPDAAAEDQFGRSVAISGNTAVIGVPFSDISGVINAGSVYVFVRSGTVWNFQQKLTVPAGDLGANDGFGAAVTIDGDYLAAGCPLDDEFGSDRGAAYTFLRTGTVWNQQAKLIAPDGVANDQFGTSISLSGNTALVGSPLSDLGPGADDRGAAYTFLRTGTAWNPEFKMTPNVGGINDRFGTSVAINGDTAVVGAPLLDAGFTDAGGAYTFQRSGLNWQFQQRLLAGDGNQDDQFGQAVSLSGNKIVVGAYLDDFPTTTNQGSTYVFMFGAGGWQLTDKLVANDGASGDHFGFSTAISGQDVISGARFNDVLSVSNQGAAYGIYIGPFTWTGAVSNDWNNPGNWSPPAVPGATDRVIIPAGAVANEPAIIFTDVTVRSLLVETGRTLTAGVGRALTIFGGSLNNSAAITGGGRVDFVGDAVTNNGSITVATFRFREVATLSLTNVNQTLSGVGSFTSDVKVQAGVTLTMLSDHQFAFLTVENGSTFDIDNNTLKLAGSPVPLVRQATGTIDTPGSTILYNGTLAQTAETNFTYNNLTIGNSNGILLGGDMSVLGILTVNNGAVFTISNFKLTLSGGGQPLVNNGTIITTGSTIEYNGILQQTAETNFTYNNLNANNASPQGILLGGDMSVNGVLTVITPTKLDISNFTLNLLGSGTSGFPFTPLVVQPGATVVTTGSTVNYAGDFQNIAPNVNYNNLIVNGNGILLGGDMSVLGTLTLNKDLDANPFTLTLQPAASVTGSADVIGNTRRVSIITGATMSFNNQFTTVRFDSGTPPTSVTINLSKTAPPAAFNTVLRTYQITPVGGAGFSATTKLHYKDSELNGLNEATLELWRYNGASWASPSGSATRDGVNNWVEESGITAFSPWTIAGPGGPTLVEMVDYSATAIANANGQEQGILLQWRTGLEVNNLGFNVYRQETGKMVRINRDLIAGSALFAGAETMLTSGRRYSWRDTERTQTDMRYFIEDVDLNGQTKLYGPIFVEPTNKITESVLADVSNSTLISEAGQHENSDASNLEGRTTKVVERLAPLPIRVTKNAVSADAQDALAAQGSVKLAIRREGLYRVTQPELVAAGLPKDIDPRNLQLFVDGIEQPIKVTGEEDGRFDAEDAIEFYGVGIDSPYSQSRVYWLLAGKQTGRRIADGKAVEGKPTAATSFMQTVERRDRTTYFAALKNGERENFFGSTVSNTPLQQTIEAQHLAVNWNGDAELEVALQGVTGIAHRVRILLNEVEIGRLAFAGQERGATRLRFSQSLLREGENRVTLMSLNTASDVSLVDSLRLSYQHRFTADQDALRFTVRGGEQVTVDGFTTDKIRLFDVTNSLDVSEVKGRIERGTLGYAIRFTSPENGSRSLFALAEGQYQRATTIQNQPSALRDRNNSADYLIITRREFFDALLPLQSYRQAQGLATMLVDIEDIYDEFSFGQKTPQAVKDFLNEARMNWQRAPRFVLLAGDASYDIKNYLGYGDTDLVPTKLIETSYLESASDDWFADFNNDGVADIAIGRFPARTGEEMSLMVTKTLNFERTGAAKSALLITDRNDAFDFETATRQVKELLPRNLQIEEVRRSQYDDATAKAQVLEAINQGPAIVNYTGHGSTDLWRGGLLTSTDARNLTNRSLSLFVVMNCLNGYFQDAAQDSLAESLLKAERGGAVAVWASSALSMPEEQAILNQYFYRNLFSNEKTTMTIGQAAMAAKRRIADIDIRRSWVLIGDPALPLK